MVKVTGNLILVMVLFFGGRSSEPNNKELRRLPSSEGFQPLLFKYFFYMGIPSLFAFILGWHYPQSQQLSNKCLLTLYFSALMLAIWAATGLTTSGLFHLLMPLQPPLWALLLLGIITTTVCNPPIYNRIFQ